MPYEDRISIATPEGVDVQLTLAGVGSRFIATAIDQALRLAIIGSVMLGLALTDPAGELALAMFVAAVFIVQFSYDVLFETLASGRTPGKRWTGLRVVTVTGAPVGFVTSAVRNLLRLVDALPGMYAVGIVAVVASPRNQRLGDMAAGTLVVRERLGGRPNRQPVVGASRSWAPPPTWDVSAITADELATVRRFLERRATLKDEARIRLADELAVRLRPKVVGPPEEQSSEVFLEELSAAKAARL